MLSSDEVSDLTIGQAVNSGPHVLLLKKTYGKELLTLMTSLLKELMMYVLNDLTDEQVVLYADTMINDCPLWKPDDFALCLRNGRQGKYGKSQARWTYTTFNEWADCYERERSKHLIEEALKHKEDYDGDRMGELTLKNYLKNKQ